MNYHELTQSLEKEIGIKLTSLTDEQAQALFGLFSLLRDVKEAARAFSIGVKNYGKDN